MPGMRLLTIMRKDKLPAPAFGAAKAKARQINLHGRATGTSSQITQHPAIKSIYITNLDQIISFLNYLFTHQADLIICT